MKMTVAFNGDVDLIPKLKSYDVESIFVKQTEDLIGGGRSSHLLPDIDTNKIKESIRVAHDNNIRANYLLNSACQSNQEYTKEHNDKLYRFIDDLVQSGIDAFVVATPFMMGFVKKHWPSIWTTVSLFSWVDNAEKAKFWEQRGADRIIVSNLVARDFKRIRKIREAVKCELEILGNLGCLYSCPFDRFHSLFVSHNSTTTCSDSRLMLDYHVLNCSMRKMKNMAELIKSRWIRPEDVTFYEELGIDTLKIVDRQKNSDWLLNAVKAYHNKKYDGNLMDIIHVSVFYGEIDASLAANPNRAKLVSTHDLDPEILKLFRSQKKVKVFIDNKKLDGFLKHFEKIDCAKMDCGTECLFCYKQAEKVMQYDQELLDYNIDVMGNVIKKMHDCSMFTDFAMAK